MPLWGERQMLRFTTWRTTNDEPPARLECPQAAADRAFIPLEGLHQLFMATQDKAFGALVICLTFRTLCRTSEAILEEPPVERGSGAIDRHSHAP